jgi:hypothetical protein
MSDAGAAGARAHRLGLAFQGASALSIHGKDTHTLTALEMTLRQHIKRSPDYMGAASG